MTLKHIFRSTVGSAIVAGSALCANTAAAQVVENPDAAQKTGVQEIIVTAQKREESLQDTPISIAVLGDEALEQRGINSVTDLMNGAVPSLRIIPLSGRASALSIGMRGIAPIDASQISRDPAVGIYIDGIYLGRVQGLGTELADVERIEVLRGPQGTLFGRNAVGGAVSVISKKPTGEFGFEMTAGAHSFGGFELESHVNLPRVAGIAVKLDGIWKRRDGWVENPLAGQSDWYDTDRRGLRATAQWEPAPEVELRYTYELSQDESTSGYAHITRLLPGAPALAPIFRAEPDRVRDARGGFLLEPSVGDVEAHSLHASWEFADRLTLRSISAWRDLRQTQFDNFAGAFLAFRPNGSFARYSQATVEQDQFSQELQLIGEFERLKFVLGGFYFEEDAADDAFAPSSARFNATGTAFTILNPPVSSAPFPDRASVVSAESRALFGQATWTPPVLDDRLHLTAGLRYTEDEKNGSLIALRGRPPATPLAFVFESDRFDPLAIVAFDVSPDVNTYLRYSTAYRAGGANSRSATFRPFEDEEVESWEAGVKADLFDRRARVNLAAYRSRYKNRQVEFGNPANPSNTETVNTPEAATIKGLELDVTVVPAAGLTLTGGYVYTDFAVPVEVNPFTGQTQRTVVALTPEHAATGAIDYEFPSFTFGRLRAHLDANYSGRFFTSGSLPPHGNYLLVNGHFSLSEIALGQSGANLELALWGKNLTNDEYTNFEFSVAGPGLTNAVLAYFNEPRSGGIRATIRY